MGKTTQEKTTLFEKLTTLSANGILPTVFRFFKSSIIHISLEMLITVYLLELFVILTAFFAKDPTQFSQPIVFIVTPLLFTLPAALIFATVAVVRYAHRFYYYYMTSKTLPEDNDSQKKVALLKSIMDNYSTAVHWGHFWGFLCYLLLPFAISLWVVSAFSNMFDNCSSLVLQTTIGGGILGAFWNITGVFREKRLMWHELLPKTDCEENRTKISTTNYKFYLRNLAGNAFSIGAIITFIVIIFFHLHENVTLEMITDYSFLILYLISLVVVYCRCLFTLLYRERDKEKRKVQIYPPLSDVLSLFNGRNQ